MTEAKHTKGPWEWDGKVWDYDAQEESPWLVDAEGSVVLTGEIRCPKEADAHLIAAAPDLLHWLEIVVNTMPEDYLPVLQKNLRAAIAKATGVSA